MRDRNRNIVDAELRREFSCDTRKIQRRLSARQVRHFNLHPAHAVPPAGAERLHRCLFHGKTSRITFIAVLMPLAIFDFGGCEEARDESRSAANDGSLDTRMARRDPSRLIRIIRNEQRLEQLQAQIEQLQQGQGQGQQPGGGFLSSLGSIFGGGPSAAPPPPPRPSQPLPGGPWGQEAQAPRSYPPQQPYPPQGGAPWGGPPPAGGGGFLSGALQSAAGVAGGVLLADSIRNLFGGHAGGLGGGFGGLGIGSGLGTGLGTTAPGLGTGGETVINNYYDDTGRDNVNDADFYDDTSSNNDDFSNNDDGSFDV